MKLDVDKLLVKVGELQVVKNVGKLMFENVTKAVYSDTLSLES